METLRGRLIKVSRRVLHVIAPLPIGINGDVHHGRRRTNSAVTKAGARRNVQGSTPDEMLTDGTPCLLFHFTPTFRENL